MRVVLSRSAAAYLRKEILYLRSRSPAAAARFTTLIREAKRNLRRFPDIGSEELHLPVPGARTWVTGDYLLDYTHEGDVIVIVTIRAGQMKPPMPRTDLDDDVADEFDVIPSDTGSER